MYIHEETSQLKEKPKSTRKEPCFFSDGCFMYSLSTPLKLEKSKSGEAATEEESEAKQEEVMPRRSTMVRRASIAASIPLSDDDDGSVSGEQNEKAFELNQFDPDTEQVV